MSCSKTIFATYCSSKKNHQSGLMPAIERYKSERINQINSAALALNIDFFILSGKFGIVNSHELIPDYDFMLTPDDVPEHSIKVESQLDSLGINQMIFFTRPVSEDKNLKSYLELIGLACNKKNISLTIINLSKKKQR